MALTWRSISSTHIRQSIGILVSSKKYVTSVRRGRAFLFTLRMGTTISVAFWIYIYI